MAGYGEPLDTKGALFGVTPLHMVVLGKKATRTLFALFASTSSGEKGKPVEPNTRRVLCAKKEYARSLMTVADKKVSHAGSSDRRMKSEVALNATLTFLLVTCKVYVDCCDSCDRTPLMYVPMARASDLCATMLLRSGGNIAATDRFGNTPLHYAYAFCSTSSDNRTSTAISLYLAAGASPNEPNMAGQTPKAVMGCGFKLFA